MRTLSIPLAEDIKKLYYKSRLLGIIKEVSTYCGKTCYLISITKSKHLLIIPDDVTRLNLEWCRDGITTNTFWKLRGELKVIGGFGLTDANAMFAECEKLTKLDLRYFCTDNIQDMTMMFSSCILKELDLSSFNTKNTKNMLGMFMCASIDNLDISSFNTSNVEIMRGMFSRCTTNTLDLSHFNTDNLSNVSWMFESCKINMINFGNIKLPMDINTEHMFNRYNGNIKAVDNKIMNEYTNRTFIDLTYI